MIHDNRPLSTLLRILQNWRAQIQYYVILCDKKTQDRASNWHAYVKLKRSQKKLWFGILNASAWIKPLQKDPQYQTLNDRQTPVRQVLQKGGAPLETHGSLVAVPRRTNNSAHILSMIKEGYRMSEIVVEYPAMYATIAKLMMQRPKRAIKTSVLYLWGLTGVGKTTMVFRVVKTSAKMGLIDYYCKGGWG